MTPEVKEVRLVRGVVHATFTDGHTMTFRENYETMRTTHDLEEVCVLAGGQKLVVFHSRYQYPVNRTPFGFVQTAPGWDPQRFAAYWLAVVQFLDAARNKGRLIDSRRVLNMGDKDLLEIQGNQWPMP